jgi:hypothetical protein
MTRWIRPYGMLGILSLLCFSCQTPHQAMHKSGKRAIDLFKQYIVGDFNNTAQVAAELQAGQQIHPQAVHVNRIADAKILGAPKVDGFWLLEESYYTYPGKPMEVKPYLFLFEAIGDTAVRLTPYKLPSNIAAPDIRNDNAQLSFDYREIMPSPSFKPANYQLREGKFYLHAVNDLGNGLRFSLIETISSERLQVMELLEKDGKRLTAYETPILYDRIRRRR